MTRFPVYVPEKEWRAENGYKTLVALTTTSGVYAKDVGREVRKRRRGGITERRRGLGPLRVFIVKETLRMGLVGSYARDLWHTKIIM